MKAGLQDPAPGEGEAGERAWEIVRAAFAEREPVRVRRRRDLRPALVLAGAAAVVGVGLGSAGATVLRAIRGEPHARTALSSLPGGGRLLVGSAGGAWVVQADGSRRRLDGYSDAVWSPHGLYVAAVKGHELVALTPGGDVRWTIARRGRVALPSWNRPDGYRVAYLAGEQLRVVGGDSHGDRLVGRRAARVRPAWKPGPGHVLAFATRDGTVAVLHADEDAPVWARRLASVPTQLAWSDDGKRLLVVLRGGLRVFSDSGRLVLAEPGTVVAAAFAPGGHSIAEIRAQGGRSAVGLAGTKQPLFTGAGELSDLAWSPDGRWLVVAWPTADQLLFIRSASVQKVVAFSSVTAAFGSFPRLGGWAR